MQSLARRFAHYCGLYIVTPKLLVELCENATEFNTKAFEYDRAKDWKQMYYADGQAATYLDCCQKIRDLNSAKI